MSIICRLRYLAGLKNIKEYLINEGIRVDSVYMWQSGFIHEGTQYGLEIIATIIVDGKEEKYCVPKYLVKVPNLEPIKILKLC